MNLSQVLDQIRSAPDLTRRITQWREIPPSEGRYAAFPESLDPRLAGVLQRRGIERLYSHQAQAVENILAGRHVVVVTPTASGKTLCYNLPVLQSLLQDPEARALYLFPTKALSQDQLDELHGLVTDLEVEIKTHTYDGDTPVSARKAIRAVGHVVITNPDMLHTGILPHHTKWVRLFENLRFVVIDEVHHYRGVFGSHLANVIRRLKRICRFYGADPVFVLSSATIANPEELASRLLEEEVVLIDDDGSPKGKKHFIFYNPPVVNPELGIRRSMIHEARGMASNFIQNDIQTIVFARTRTTTELLLSYLEDDLGSGPARDGRVRGYRGGYLPQQRREIERGLREGSVRGVVATNALELGIDIGQLDACVMAGYPGTITSTWQQAGRAGRRNDVSCAVLVASSSPLDQYIINHPAYFFGQSPERALVNPNNLLILASHIKCAAFELPFRKGEQFGVETTEEILSYLEEQGVLRRVEDTWHWMSESYPAEEISLRTATSDNVVIVDVTDTEPRVIGEVDTFSAPTMVHEEAIYLHEGRQFQVEELDWEEKKAYVTAVDVDYYTDANLAVQVKVLEVFDREGEAGKGERARGEVLVSALPTVYKKIKLYSHENVGWGDIVLPEQEMHTTAYWIAFSNRLTEGMTKVDLESALVGVSQVLASVGPLFLMCDPRDLGTKVEVKSPFTDRPTIFLYDKVPAGIGFAERLYELHDEVLASGAELVRECPCLAGCPSCVGPVDLVGESGKRNALRILSHLAGSERTPDMVLAQAAGGNGAKPSNGSDSKATRRSDV